MPRVSKNTEKLEAVRSLMGTLPDHVIAERADVTASAVGRFRRKHGIKAYEGYKFGTKDGDAAEAPVAKKSAKKSTKKSAKKSSKKAAAKKAAPKKAAAKKAAPKKAAAKKAAPKKAAAKKAAPKKAAAKKAAPKKAAAKKAAPKKAAAKKAAAPKRTERKGRGPDKKLRKSKLSPYYDQLGKAPDKDIAAKAGVTVEAVRMYRRRHGIAVASKVPKKAVVKAAPRRRASKLDPFRDQLGKIPDSEVAAKAGVTAENVRSYRRRHDIPAEWREAKAAPKKAAPKKAAPKKAAPKKAAPKMAAPKKAAKAPVAPKAAAPAPKATTAEAQGFSVTVSVDGSAREYLLVSSDIATAAARAVSLMSARHPGSNIVAVRHLGAAID